MRRPSVTSIVLEEPTHVSKSTDHKLSFVEFVLVASLITGVPYGMEWCVLAAGVGPTLLSLIGLGMFYALPMCLISTELSCMMPTNHGSVIWSYRAFYNVSPKLSDFVGFMNALNQCAIYSVGLSIVPIIFTDYFQTITGELSFGASYGVMLFVIVSTAVVNVMNVKAVGIAVSILFIFAVVSFIVGFFASIPNIEVSQWSQTCSHYDLPFFVAIVAWFGSGYEFMGNLMGEIGFAKSKLIIAYLVSIVVSVFILSVPVIASATIPYTDCDYWYDGYFAVAYGHILGDAMYWTIVVGALTCEWSLYCVAVALSARVFWAISQPEICLLKDGRLIIEGDVDDDNPYDENHIDRRIPIAVLPKKWLGTLWDRTGAPLRAVLFQTSITAINCLWVNAGIVIEVCIYFYFITFCVIVFGFITLKYYEPNCQRLFSVPLGMYGAWICFILLMGFMLTIMVFLVMETYTYFGICLATNAVFAIYYAISNYCKSSENDERNRKNSLSLLETLDEQIETETETTETQPLLVE